MAKHLLEQALADSWPPDQWKDHGVIVAVSGGADSVALLRAMLHLKVPGTGLLAAAHFDHGLRGSESAADQSFVVDLCRSLHVPCHTGDPPQPLAPQATDGIEAAARNARYEFLRHTAEQLGVRYLATAHTADDQAETVLHRILRGTGIAGLSGMPRARPLSPAVTLIRPMLPIRRALVLDYLSVLGQPFRADSTNADLRFTRNRIRRELLPLLAANYNAEVADSLLRLGSLAGEVQEVIDALADRLAGRALLDQNDRGLQIDAAQLASQPRYLVRETLIAMWRRQAWPMQSMGRQEWDLLAEMVVEAADAPHGTVRRRVFPGNILAESAAGQLRLTQPEG